MTPEDYEQLQALVRLFQGHGLEELVIEERSFRLRLRAGRAARGPASGRLARHPRKPARVEHSTSVKTGRTVAVRSPLIGVFYRAPGPGAPPFVAVGDQVQEGQTVGIVEAMKVMNEIKAEWSGRVVAIPAQNGRLVRAGEPLVVLEFTLEAAPSVE